MNDKKINEWLKAQIEAETPDMLDTLMSELPKTEQVKASDSVQTAPIPMKRKKRGIPFAAAAVAAAACLVLGLIGGGIWGGSRRPEQSAAGGSTPVGALAASVTFDVNPSVKMKIDDNNRVISCESINDEGKEILKEMDLSGSDVVVASYAVVGGMLTNGYLTDATNSVLVSVTAEDKAKGEEVEKYLAQELNTYLEKSAIGAAIIGQYIDEDDTVEAFAEANGISEGKAWIIKQLAASNPRLTEDSLVKLSTQELMVLWTNRRTEKNSQAASGSAQPKKNQSSMYGTVSTKKYISSDEALKKALTYVGVKKHQARDIEVDFECEKGVIIYEVDFDYNGREYGIDVDAVSGKIIGGAPGKASTLKQKPGVEVDDDDDDDDWDDRYERDDDDDDDDRYERDDDDDDDDDDWDDDDD